MKTHEKPELPEPIYAEGVDHQADPWAWPLNWPHSAEWPIVEKPCGCKGFAYPEPFEPDWDDQ